MGKEGNVDVKWMGAVLIVGSCGGFGLSIAAANRRQTRLLNQLVQLLKLMEWELRYRLTALPELCFLAAKEADGVLKKVFQDLSKALSQQSAPDSSECMGIVLRRNQDIPPKLRKALRRLGSVMGRFDLEGQLEGFRSIREEIQNALQNGGKEQEQRMRSYQTLCICAGLALVILLV